MWCTVNFGKANSRATVYYRVLNADKTVSVARTATGVSQYPAGSGVFGVNIAEASVLSKTLVWDIDNSARVAADTYVAPSGSDDVLAVAVFGRRYSGKTAYYTVLNNDGTVYQARTSTGVTELVTGSGLYGVQVASSIYRTRTIVFDIGIVNAAIAEFLTAAAASSGGVVVQGRIYVR